MLSKEVFMHIDLSFHTDATKTKALSPNRASI